MLGLSSSFSSYLHAPASGPLHCSTRIQTTPIINQHCRYYLGPTRHQNRKRVRLLRLCPQLVGQSWKRRRCGVSLLGTMSRRKGGDPTTNKAYVSPHVVFDEASSWWSTENIVLPDSESLDTSMRAQLPERQEVSVGSDSKPVESQKSSSRTGSSLRAPFDRRQVFARFKVQSP